MFDIPPVMLPVFILLGAMVIAGVLCLAMLLDEWFDSKERDD